MNKFGFLLKEGFKSIFTHGLMSFASVTIIMACLLIMGSFSLLSINIDNMIGDLESENQVLAIVDENYTEEQARALESQIAAVPNVASVEFITRQEAMDSFSERYPDKIFEGIEASTFRDRFAVYLDDLSLTAETAQALESIDGIVEVSDNLDIANGFVTVRNVVSGVSMVLVLILVIVSIFIMANTIKLTTYGRREEIAIMRMVGATNAFIRFPFLVEGLILGLFGAALAFFIEWGVYDLVFDRIMASLAGNIVEILPFTTLMLPVLIVYLGIGAFVGAFGGLIAIRNYLKV
jgi:cell division transport system permease protein